VTLLFSLIFLFQACDGEASSSSSSSSEAVHSAALLFDHNGGQSEMCPTCLLSFTTQEIGTIDTCEHSFCVGCVLEWSKVSNCITFRWFQKGIFGKIKVTELEGIR
jgi:hypothetical protein